MPSLPDLSRFRELFPITESRAYLFAGGLAPAAVPVRAAMDEWTDRWMFDPVYHRVEPGVFGPISSPVDAVQYPLPVAA